MIYKYREGTQAEKPKEIDAISSAKVVYVRKNIREVEKEDLDGSTYTVWGYDEAEMSKEDFVAYSQALSLEKQAAMDETLADILLNQMEV